jgi:hypothetical protein
MKKNTYNSFCPDSLALRWTRGLSMALLLACAMTNRMQAAESWMFAKPEPLPSPINLPGSGSLSPWLSADGLTLYFGSDRPGGYGLADIWVSERSSAQENWGEPVNLGPEVNTSAPEGLPCLSADGLTLYFGDGNPYSLPARNGSADNYQIWMTTRATRQSPWVTPVELEAPVNSASFEAFPFLSGDGLSLYFTSTRTGSYGLNVAWRASPTEPWLTATNLGVSINPSGTASLFPWVSADGLRLIYQSNRPGGRGADDLWMATRLSTAQGWGVPVNLGSQVNSANHDVSPWPSADFPAVGSYLLFARNHVPGWTGPFKIYKADVIPNMTVLRATASDGPWTAVAASFSKKSTDAYEAEVSANAGSTQSFYRIMMTGNEGVLRIKASTKSALNLRIQFERVR